MPLRQPESVNEAKLIMSSGLAESELAFVASICAPLYWAIRRPDGTVQSSNGTAFFLNAGSGVFGVTACHVIDGWRRSQQLEDAGPLRIGAQGSSLQLDWDARQIDADSAIDIATFTTDQSEVTKLGKTVLTGFQRAWPPGPPQQGRGIYYCGYPGVATLHPSPREVCFGCMPGSGIASSVNERDISTQIEREHWVAAFGHRLPPENFAFGGISGGPMLTVVETSTLRPWALAGVIFQGPNPSGNLDEAIAGLEIIKARRAHFVLPNGTLDTSRWRLLP
jgi:hypothetical protein